MKKIFLFLFLVFLQLSHADSIVAYREYPSPNKIYSAQVSVRETDSLLVIKNKISGKIELSMKVLLTPILDVQWSPNSKYFILIQHLAGCSLASLVTHVNNNWKKYDCDPSLKWRCRYSILGIKFFKDVVRLTYGVSREKRNDELLLNLVVFDVNDKTGSMSPRKIEPLSVDAFITLRKKEEKNWISL